VRRSTLLALVFTGVVVFLLVSALLARAFSVDSAERSAITSVVQAEARGDTAAVINRFSGCATSPACRARARADVAALHRAGAVAVIQVQASAGFSLTGSRGIARVAWSIGGSLPIVQCVRVHRAGNVFSGLRIELLALSRRIASDGACPTSF
jgi:hypothetical protein